MDKKQNILWQKKPSYQGRKVKVLGREGEEIHELNALTLTEEELNLIGQYKDFVRSGRIVRNSDSPEGSALCVKSADHLTELEK